MYHEERWKYEILLAGTHLQEVHAEQKPLEQQSV